MNRTRIRRLSAWLSTVVLTAFAAVAVTTSPAWAEPHADAKRCHTGPLNGRLPNDVFASPPIGAPYGQELVYGTFLTLYSGSVNAYAYGTARLKAGDYFSIDRTNEELWGAGLGEHMQLTTGGMQPYFGYDFTWHYCEKIRKKGTNGPWYDWAPTPGEYETQRVTGAHRGIRLCITRPPVDRAWCAGDGTGSRGWYVDLDDVDHTRPFYPYYMIPDGGPDEPSPPAGGGSQSANMTVMQANTGFLYAQDSGGWWHDLELGMMRGTSPATSDGQIAFQANTGTLFTRSVNGGVRDSGYGMAAGTSPSISGGQIAFQANNTLLHTRNMNTGQTTDLRLGMMAGTSPSIAGNTSSWRIAFQANDGFLYYRDSGGATVNTGLGMMRGTSPSITKLSNGTYVIAFQANTGFLYSYSNNQGSDLRLGLMTGTSPAIASSGNSWTIAFQANTGFLFTRNSAGAVVDTRYGMMAQTSPAARGNRIVFQANTGFLFYRDGTSAAVDTQYGMMTGTSPGV